jgi:hypothetical protein
MLCIAMQAWTSYNTRAAYLDAFEYERYRIKRGYSGNRFHRNTTRQSRFYLIILECYEQSNFYSLFVLRRLDKHEEIIFSSVIIKREEI